MSGRPLNQNTQTARQFIVLLLRASGRRNVAMTLGLTVAGSLAEGAGLLMLVPVLNLIGIGGQGMPAAGSLTGGLGLYLLLVTVGGGIVALRTIHSAAERNHFVDRLRADLHDALLRVSWSSFQRLRGTDLMHAIMGETGRLGLCYTQLISLLASLVTIPALLIVALFLSPTLTTVTLVVACTTLLLIRRIGRSGFGIGIEMGRAAMAMTADLSDDLAGLRTIKSLGGEAARSERLAKRFAELRRLQMDQTRIQALEHAALTVTAALVACVAILTAILWLKLDLPSAMVVIVAFARLAQRGLDGIRIWRQLEANLPSILIYQDKLAGLKAGAEPPVDTASPLPPFTHTLCFTAVSFCTLDGRRALDGVDLTLPYGAVLVVTGPSGAGKSTLADLAAGLISPTSGTLLLDGAVLPADLLPVWRQQVGVVPQDPFLFHDTIRANLLLADPAATEAGLWSVLEDAGAADFVRALPQGLDTVVGDRGNAVSGGERQRLAIARALLRKPRLLILDEATSALDGGSETLVLHSLERLRGRVTMLVVTHREQTRQIADLVLELDGGRKTYFGPLRQHHVTGEDAGR
jgi:ATP-binding cassette subfamily C protein